MHLLSRSCKNWSVGVDDATGEGALQALRGSSTGLGTDIGQSATSQEKLAGIGID